MSRVSVTRSKLDSLATVISSKSGATLPLTIDQMYTAVDNMSGGATLTTKSITTNGTYNASDDGADGYSQVTVNVSPALQNKTATPTETAQTITADNGYDGLSSVSVGAISSSYVGSAIDRNDSTDLTASGATVSVPAGYYADSASKSVASGTEGTPTATKGSVSNHAVTITPSVTNSEGYIQGGTHTGTGVSVSASELVSGTYNVTSPGTKDVTNYESASIPAGTVTAPSSISGTGATVTPGTNTLTLSKSVSVTPNVTAEGYISSGTAGNANVSLSANVTTQGAQTIYPSTSDQTINSGRYLTGNQTIKAVAVSNTLIASNIKSGVTVTIGDSADADRVMSVTGTYSGGGSVQYDTKTATASNYPTSLNFTGMEGMPKFFTVRLNAQVSSSGSTTYYYIVNITSNGTTTHGNCFRIGSTRRVDNIASGYSWSYSGTTLTVTSSASSRSASPGAFYNGSYELMYAY